MGIFRRVCFLKFFDLRYFCWSKAGVPNRDGGEAEGGKGFLNCQIVRLTEIATYFNGMPNLVILRRVPWRHLFQGFFL